LDLKLDESVTKEVRGVSSKFDAAYWREVSERAAFPSEYWKAIGKAGLFGILVGKEWGGMGKDLVDAALATIETAERYAGLGSYLFLSGALTPLIFAKNANDEAKKKLLPSLISGAMRVSIALTEEESGSDSASINTVARNISGHYLIDGAKMFVTNAEAADLLLLFARTKPAATGRRGEGISMFLVDTKSRGLKTERLAKLGVDFNTLDALEIKGLKAGEDDLVGTVHEGLESMKGIFEMDRILTAASLVGTGRLALDTASAYAKQRTVFGKPVGSYQGIQFPMADAWAQLLAAESMVLKAASMFEDAKRPTNEANSALLEAQSASAAATDRALQAFGGHGYLKRHDVERYWRDVRVHRLHPVTEELLLSMLATRALGLPTSS